jgi:predicted kinase
VAKKALWDDTYTMRELLLLSALPGSGKSSWAKLYAKEHKNVKIVSSDAIRIRLFGSQKNFSNEPLVWKTFLEDLQNLGQEDDVTVIVDSTNLNNYYRTYYVKETPMYEKHTLVLFDVSYEDCLKQNLLRPKEMVVDPENMEELRAQWEEASEEAKSYFDEVIHVDAKELTSRLKKEKESQD